MILLSADIDLGLGCLIDSLSSCLIVLQSEADSSGTALSLSVAARLNFWGITSGLNGESPVALKARRIDNSFNAAHQALQNSGKK